MSEKGKCPYNNQRKEKGNFNPTKNIKDILQKVVKVPQEKEIEEPNTNDPIIIQNLFPLKNPKRKPKVPISNSGIKSLTPYEDIDVYSESGDTFDEFDYEEEELEDLEEENINKNPALYLTNIEEVSTKKDDKKEKEKTVKERIKEI
ncbi:1451_t:CDS:2, partial [Gigaspora margarita]